jgi:hypothetical protein
MTREASVLQDTEASISLLIGWRSDPKKSPAR